MITESSRSQVTTRPSAVCSDDLLELTDEEEKAVRSLKRLARRWPDSLLVFCGGTGMSIRKGGTGAQYEVASIYGMPCDGGDGGDKF